MFSFNYFTKTGTELQGGNEVLTFLASEKLLNVHQYPMKVHVTPHFTYLPYSFEDDMGIFGKVIEIMCLHLNASPEWVFELAEKDLYSALNSNSINLYPFKVLQQTNEEFSFVALPTLDGLCFLITETPIGSYFRHLAVPFNVEVWIAILLIIVIVRILNGIFEQQLPRDLLSGYFFGLNVADYELEKLERFAMIALTWLFFLAGEAYLAKMISFMNNNKMQPHYKTIADFVQSDHYLCQSQYSIYAKLNDTYPALLQMVGEDDENCISLLTCSEIALFTKAFTTAADVTMYTLSDRLNWFILANIFSSRQPFAPRFEHIFNQLVECGLWKLWTTDDIEAREIIHFAQLELLTFQDLISMWWLLVCGFSVAGVAFIWELSIDRVKMMRENRRAARTKLSN